MVRKRGGMTKDAIHGIVINGVSPLLQVSETNSNKQTLWVRKDLICRSVNSSRERLQRIRRFNGNRSSQLERTETSQKECECPLTVKL